MKACAPAVDDAAHLRGIELFKSGSYEDAAAELKRALSVEETAERWNDWASAEFALNHVAEAERGFRRAISLSPEHPDAAANLALLLTRSGRSQEAIPLLEKCHRGIGEEQQGAVAQLLGACKAAECLPQESGSWQKPMELGLAELKQRHDLAKARALFEQACTMNPNASVAWFFLGLTCFHMGMFALAERVLEKAEALGYRTPLGAQTRGDAFYNQGRFEEALLAYQTALKREPGNAGICARLGLATVRSGNAEKGLRRLQEDLAAMPYAPELYEGLILSYVATGQTSEAAQSAENKVRMVANAFAGDYLRAASLWAQLHEWRRATGLLEEGLQKHAGNPELQRALQEAQAAGNAH